MIPDPPPPDLRAYAALTPEDDGPDVEALRGRLAARAFATGIDLGEVPDEDPRGRFGDASDSDDDTDDSDDCEDD